MIRLLTRRATVLDQRIVYGWSTVLEVGIDASPADGTGTGLSEVFYIPDGDMPVSTSVFADNFHRYQWVPNVPVLIGGQTLGDRVIAPGNVDNSIDLSLKRANTTSWYAHL